MLMVFLYMIARFLPTNETAILFRGVLAMSFAGRVYSRETCLSLTNEAS
jgi:hypothetical protein